MKRKLLRLALLLCGLTLLLSSAALAANVDEGSCGIDVTWTLDNNGLLTIRGSGEMADYNHDSNPVPWNQYSNQILRAEIKEGVTTVGRDAFYNCINLSNIIIPDSVTAIHEGAFWHCMSLMRVTIPNRVTELSASCFEDCAKLSSIIIPASLTSVKENAFSYCSSLTDVYYVGREDQWRVIEILSGNNDLKNASRHEVLGGGDCGAESGDSESEGRNVTWLLSQDGELTISGVGAMTNFTQETIAPWDALTEKITKVNIQEGVTNIGNYAFSHSASLAEVLLPDSLTAIGTAAFQNCAAISYLELPKKVTTIGRGAFLGCGGLTEIVLPEGLSKIQKGTFQGCGSLKSITFHNGVTEVEAYAFEYCKSLGPRAVGEGEDQTIVRGDVYFYGTRAQWEGETLTIVDQYNDDLKNANIHFIAHEGTCGAYPDTDTVKWVLSEDGELTIRGTGRMQDTPIYAEDSVPWYPYRDEIKTVTILEGVENVGDSSFIEYPELETVNLPSSIDQVGDHAFYNCSKLKEINIPEDKDESDVSKMITIGSYAFNHCTSITRLYIPTSMMTVGSHSFADCSSLEELEYGGGADEWRQIDWGEGNEDVTDSPKVTIVLGTGERISLNVPMIDVTLKWSDGTTDATASPVEVPLVENTNIACVWYDAQGRFVKMAVQPTPQRPEDKLTNAELSFQLTEDAKSVAFFILDNVNSRPKGETVRVSNLV